MFVRVIINFDTDGKAQCLSQFCEYIKKLFISAQNTKSQALWHQSFLRLHYFGHGVEEIKTNLHTLHCFGKFLQTTYVESNSFCTV